MNLNKKDNRHEVIEKEIKKLNNLSTFPVLGKNQPTLSRHFW